MYEKITLDNGLKIVAYPIQNRESVSLGIWVRVGGRYESFEQKGMSHFLEHMVFKGTKRYSCRQIKEMIEGIGGSLNGFTSEELTCFWTKLPYRYLDLGLSILSDMVINPLLSEKDLEKERTVILEEIKMYRDHPQSYVFELLDELLWPNQPLGLPIIGTYESVKNITQKDMLSFKETYYIPSNIVISIAGRFNLESFIRKVRRIFNFQSSILGFKFPAALENKDKPGLTIFNKETEQIHLALGFYGFKRNHPLRHALTLLHIILGANMSSRLFNEIREKHGLAYEIGTQVRRLHDTGSFIVHAGIDVNKIEEAVRLILRELIKTRDSLVDDDEFKRAREFMLGQLRLGLEDTLEQMFWLGENMSTQNTTYTIRKIIQEVNQVTKKDIIKVASILFKKENLKCAIIGPVKEKERIYPILELL